MNTYGGSMERPREAGVYPPPGSCLVLVTLTLLLLAPPNLAMTPRHTINSQGRKLFGGYRIVPQPCKSQSNSRHGVCMFNYECVQRAGEVIGACMDGFLFGACCHLPPGSLLPAETAFQPVKDAIPAPSTVGASTDVISLVSPSSTTDQTTTNVAFVSTKLPLNPFKKPTPPTFRPKTTQRPPLIVEESIDNTASISHILNLLNNDTDQIPNTTKQPSLSTWVSVGSTQKYPSTVNVATHGPGYSVTLNSNAVPLEPLTPRPTPSAPAPTVIVLGPFSEGVPPLTPDVISRPPGGPVEAVLAEEYEGTTLDPSSLTLSFAEPELDNKVYVFMNKIVNSLAGDFQNLEDVVLSKKNLTISATTTTTTTTSTTTTPKPTRKPTTVKTTTTSAPLSTAASVVEEDNPIKPNFRRECGVRPLVKNGRIVGGKGATFGEWPWQVLVRESTWLGLFTKNKCGGVLITNKYVITAAHCQPGFLASLVAVFGEYDLSGELESRRAIIKNVRRVIIHRSYEPATFENDIALLELESPVTFDEHIVPICLPDDNADFTGRVATVSGWGRLKYGGGVPNVLQEVQVPVIENSVCQEMFHTAGHTKSIISSFLCAGYANGQKDSCEGDSGGPLMLEKNGRWVLAGTVSHGIKCAAPYLPGVYMRTTYYKPWLKTITGAS